MRNRSFASRATVTLLFIFLIFFPKAGIKISEIPITFGYIFLALVGIYLTATGIASGQLTRMNRWGGIALSALIPLQIYSVISMFFLGSENIGLSVAYIVSFVALPTIFLFCFRNSISKIDTESLLNHLRVAVTFVAIYGIFLFIWRIQMGYFIEIPYLTVNADDVGELDTKNINRGDGILKLISTYNNGNIFGVCMLMLLPLYDVVQRSRILKLTVRVALVLTLSRTVWLGLFAYEVLAAFYVRGAKREAIIVLAASTVVIVIGVSLALQFLGLDISFLFDSNLGGRADTLYATKLDLLPGREVIFPSEIIYANIINAFGIMGLILFCLAMFTPVLAAWRYSRFGRINRALVLGMIMFLVCGLSDGPMLLIPVMAIYWALAAIGIAGLKWHPAEVGPFGLGKHRTPLDSDSPIAR